MAVPLHGRRVLITGAAGDFGSAITRALRARGAQVAGLDLVESDDVRRCDITDDAAVSAAVPEAIGRLGGLDVLINNAGIGLPSEAGSPVEGAVRDTIEVNLLGAWRVTAAALPDLVKSRGRAVFIASGLAFVSFPFAAAYAVSKRGVSAYADALRVEYGGCLHVSTVYPGYVRTAIHQAPAAAGLTLEGKVPAEDVADVVRTVLRTLTAERPPHDTGTTWWGGSLIRAARCLPVAAQRLVRREHQHALDAGEYDDVPLAQRLLRARQATRTEPVR